MGILKKFIDNYREKRDKDKEYEEEYRRQKRLVEKMKDANERELERYLEEDRKAKIEMELKMRRKKAQDAIWHANNFSHNKNLFKSKKMKLGGGHCMMK